MPSLKRLVFVAAVALFVLLGAAPSAMASQPTPPAPPAPPDGSGVAPPSAAPEGDLSGGLGTEGEAKPPLLSPAPKPQRAEDPPPEEGLPGWLWAALALLTGGVAAVAVFLMRGSRPPANSVPVLESTAELLAVGRGHPPMTDRRPGSNDR